MAKGFIRKWTNKGYGFIQAGENHNIFVHISSFVDRLTDEDLKELSLKDVDFTMKETEGNFLALDVRFI